jgi:hypothetical protein
MFVKESIESVLAPKNKQEIDLDFSNLYRSEKIELLFNIGMNKYEGSYNDFFAFLYDLLEIEFDKKYSDYLNNLHYPSLMLNDVLKNLSNDEINKIVKELIPGFVTESIKDTLKPKTQDEINKSIQDIFDVESVKQKLEGFSMNQLLCLYVWEQDWDNALYSKNTTNILNALIENVLEAYKEDWQRKIVVYRINPNEDGTFVSEGRGPEGYSGVKILVEIDITKTYEDVSKIDLNIWD